MSLAGLAKKQYQRRYAQAIYLARWMNSVGETKKRAKKCDVRQRREHFPTKLVGLM